MLRAGDGAKGERLGHEVSFGGNEIVLKLDCGDGCTTLNIIKLLNCTL